MKVRLAVVMLVACSTSKPQAEPEAQETAAAARAPRHVAAVAASPDAALETLITDDAVGLARITPELFPLLPLVDKFADPAERCWPELKTRMVAGYHVLLPSSTSPSQHDTYFLAEGAWSRAELERCALRAFKSLELEVQSTRNVSVFQTRMGTVSVAWVGTFLLLGDGRQVSAALRPQKLTTAARWRALLAQAPPHVPIWVLSTDPRPSNTSVAIGPPTTDVMYVIERMERQPHPRQLGRFVAHYASAEAAAQSLAWIKSWSARGKWPFVTPPAPTFVKLYDRMARGIAALKITQQGNQLEIAWDTDQLGGTAAIAGFFSAAGEAMEKTP